MAASTSPVAASHRGWRAGLQHSELSRGHRSQDERNAAADDVVDALFPNVKDSSHQRSITGTLPNCPKFNAVKVNPPTMKEVERHAESEEISSERAHDEYSVPRRASPSRKIDFYASRKPEHAWYTLHDGATSSSSSSSSSSSFRRRGDAKVHKR